MEDGITFVPHRDGANGDVFVEFKLFPLLLQDQVSSLWRDPAVGANQILPVRFPVDIGSTVIMHCERSLI